MAASSERGTARIKVQVVATLLPLNIPVHVDPFWAFIRFSESPTIGDVENKIVVCLNCMGEEYPVELVVHDSPITPAWTYLPTSSTVQYGNHPHQTKISKSNISDASVSEQQLSIVLRPLSRKCGSWIKKAKPPKPVLISYEMSHHLPKSARSILIFKSQLVFMHDSVLLSGSKSDILRDNDVVTINAICYFCFVKADGTSEGLSCKQMGATPEVEIEPNASLWDLDEDSLFCETETQNRTNTEANLSSEIRTKIDTLLKKLANLQHSNQNEKSSREHRKSKKRKAEDIGSRSEFSERFVAVSDRIDAQVEEKRKAEEKDRLELSKRIVAFADRIDDPSEGKRTADHVDNDSILSNSFVATTDRSNVEGEKQQKASVDHQWAQDENNINDDNCTDNQLSKSKKKKKKSKKKMKSDVEVDSLMDTSVTQTTDEINLTLQTSLDVNDKQEDLVPVDSSTNVVAPSVATPSRRKAAKAGFGLSSLLSALRKQQTHEIKGREKSEIKSQEVDKQRNENTVPVSEKTDVNFDNVGSQFNSAITPPKRKRVRKRRKKNSNPNLDKNTSDKQISESVVRDYTLKLPEHQMPQNNRVTFEGDSDDDVAPASQTVKEEIQSVSCVHHNEHPPTDNSVTENAGQLSSQSEEQLKSEHHSTARSDATKTFSTVAGAPINPDATKKFSTVVGAPINPDATKTLSTMAGAPINPDEKFQALLHQCGRTGRQFETINSANGHTVIRSSRKKRVTHPGISAVADTVDPDGDGLTNVSIITQAPASNSSSHGHCFPPAVEDGMSNLSHLYNGKLNTSFITSTPELKPGQPLVEVTPLYMNYSSCAELCGVPKEADIIAYKILEMAEDYTPGLSNFKEAKVIQVDVHTGSLLLEPRGGKDNKKRLGRFELSFTDDKATVIEQELVEVNLADLVDTRLVFRADGSQ